MAVTRGRSVYERLGVRPIINAQGNRTVLGGSQPTALVKEAMNMADGSYVEMRELLEKSGEYIAEILGVEAAYVTSGCAAALALSAAACIAGNDPDKVAQLPNTAGLKNEIVFQKRQRYSYDRSYTVPGGVIIEAGDDEGCSVDQLGAAIGPDTAAVAYLIQPEPDDAVVSLEDAVELAHSRGVPLIADAAAQVYPLDFFRRNAQSSDLVCFGAKYIGAPHSAGFLCGRKELVGAAVDHGFIGFQTGGGRAFGRPMKVDRQEVVGVVAAVEAWFTMNHEDRLLGYEDRLTDLQDDLRGIPGIETKIVRNQRYWGVGLHVVLDTKALGKTAEEVSEELDAGDPRIWVNVEGDDTIPVNVHTMNEGEEHIVADRLREVLLG